MDTASLLGVAILMAVGLVGVVLPVVPGLLLIAAAGVIWAWLADGVTPWAVLGAMLVVLALGTVAKYVLPGRTLKESGAPRSTLVLAAAGALIGLFAIPVVGIVVGGIAGLWIGEQSRLHDSSAAWRSTWTTVKAIGLGMLVEFTAGVGAVLIWALGALLLA